MNTSTMLALAAIALVSAPSFAQEAATESCARIRERIAAQAGELVKPDTELLKTVGASKDCRFTSAEVYRAGFGEQPKVPYEPPRYRTHDGHDEDD